ncbi:MAG: YchJ family protein [Bdellovibrionales bacterium]
MTEFCPCGSTKTFSSCCEPYLRGKEAAPTPETLMRSRYTAFCIKDLPYIEATTDPQRRLDFDFEATARWMNESEFMGLEVLSSSEEGTKGRVEFRALYRSSDGLEQTHHEYSRFRKQRGIWYFSDGRVVTKPT